MLTQERLKELLHYDPETGVFTRRVYRNSNARAGDVAGTLDPLGHLKISIDYKGYQCHRLAWLYMNGYFPELHIDHINRDAADNRLCNLREVSVSCNIKNSKQFANNTSGVKGVSWNNKGLYWEANITNLGKRTHVSGGSCFAEAAALRCAMEQCVDWSSCDSSSPASQFMKNYVAQQKLLRS